VHVDNVYSAVIEECEKMRNACLLSAELGLYILSEESSTRIISAYITNPRPPNRGMLQKISHARDILSTQEGVLLTDQAVTLSNFLDVLNFISEMLTTGRIYEGSTEGEKRRGLDIVLRSGNTPYCCTSVTLWVILNLDDLILNILQAGSRRLTPILITLASVAPCVQRDHMMISAIINGQREYFNHDTKWIHEREPEASDILTADSLIPNLIAQALCWTEGTEEMSSRCCKLYSSLPMKFKEHPLVKHQALTNQKIHSAHFGSAALVNRPAALLRVFQQLFQDNHESVFVGPVARDYLEDQGCVAASWHPEVRAFLYDMPSCSDTILEGHRNTLIRSELLSRTEPDDLKSMHLLVIGGSGPVKQSTLELFVVDGGDWILKAPARSGFPSLPHGLSGSAGIVIGHDTETEIVLVAGKTSASGLQSPKLSRDVLILRPMAAGCKNWHKVSNAVETARSDFGLGCVTLLFDGIEEPVLVVIGGCDIRCKALASVEALRRRSGVWSNIAGDMLLPDLPPTSGKGQVGLASPGVAVVGSRIYVIGGDLADETEEADATVLDQVCPLWP
jgi:hypothetical protein